MKEFRRFLGREQLRSDRETEPAAIGSQPTDVAPRYVLLQPRWRGRLFVALGVKAASRVHGTVGGCWESTTDRAGLGAARRSGGRQTLSWQPAVPPRAKPPQLLSVPSSSTTESVSTGSSPTEASAAAMFAGGCSGYCWLCLSRWAGFLGVRVRPGSLLPALFVPGLCLPVLYKTFLSKTGGVPCVECSDLC